MRYRLAREGVLSTDGRGFRERALTWGKEPLPLMARLEGVAYGADGHYGSTVAGRLEFLRREDGWITAWCNLPLLDDYVLEMDCGLLEPDPENTDLSTVWWTSGKIMAATIGRSGVWPGLWARQERDAWVMPFRNEVRVWAHGEAPKEALKELAFGLPGADVAKKPVLVTMLMEERFEDLWESWRRTTRSV